MPWTLNNVDAAHKCLATAGETLYIVASDDGDLVATQVAPKGVSLILGTLAVHSYGAKLEAGNDDLVVSPAGPSMKTGGDGSNGLQVEELILQARTHNRIETIVLRDQDKISSAKKSGSLIFAWVSPQVQVHSSEKQEDDGAMDIEDETEDDDDEDLDNTIVPGPGKSQTRSTPHMSESISHYEVIQETPTVNRVGDATDPVVDFSRGPPGLSNETSTATVIVQSTALQEESIVDDLTLLKEAADGKKSEVSDALPRRTRMTKVAIPTPGSTTKRPIPPKEEPRTPSARATKRRKVDHDDADAKTPVQTVRKAATKKRVSVTKTEPTPLRSQRSTPASTADSIKGSAVQIEGDYEGPPKPRVALSNSAIQPNGSFAKFLKKHGSLVDTVDSDCNILCIKEGPVLKTTKLLQAVAHGLPIITDKWLIDSAKANRLAPLDPYMPPDLKPVWKIPQSRLFQGYTIYFTPTLKAHYNKVQFNDMQELCKAVGARRVVSKKPGGKDLDQNVVYLADAKDDPDVPALLEQSHVCYTKDFLTHSIIGGDVDWDSEEHRVQPAVEKPAKKKGRGRKA